MQRRWRFLAAAVAAALLPLAAAPSASAVALGESAPARSTVATPQPILTSTSALKVVWRPIPYGATRKAQMAAYSWRRYRVNTWQLRPTAIVLHYTVSSTASSAINTFAGSGKSGGEYPNVCAHFVVDKNGTVYQLVPTNVMCRHTVGLNNKAIGIEVVQEKGTHSNAWAEQQILARPAQMHALLTLVRTLQGQWGIGTSHVYGHGTANSAPEFYDRTGLRNDHVDWDRWALTEFRRRLTAGLSH